MRLLLDENMSDRRLAARLRAQGHDPVLATDVGLLSATDARVFICGDHPGPTRVDPGF